MPNKIELLSPAGNFECLVAAVQAGCDAVYLSGKNFGARSYAGNFDNDELLKAVEYCHLHNVLVYVTVNTLVKENEFKELDVYLNYLNNINVDAVIVQDLGVIRFIKLNYPTLEVHASTQLNVFNKEGAALLKKLGVTRVVLARETSIDILKEINQEDIETEVFIHGALCFSSSGNCLMSSAIGGRSGNRGKCAQPCRKTYSLYEDNNLIVSKKALLSMKDLMTLEHIDELIDANITSLKIEGRMKSKEYVYIVTKAYREAIDEYYKRKQYSISNQTINNLKLVFNREFTKGYLFNENNIDVTNINSVNHQGLLIGKVLNATKDFIEISLNSDISLHDGLRVLSKEEYGLFVTSIYVNGNNVKKAYKNQIAKFFINNNSKIGDLVVMTTSETLSKEINEILKHENIKHKISLDVSIFSNYPLKVTVRLGDYQFTINSDVLEYSEQLLSVDRIKEQLSKLTSTVYEIDSIKIKTDEHAFVRVSMLNAIRRSFVDELNKYLTSKKNKVLPCYFEKENSNKVLKFFEFEVFINKDYQRDICEKFNIKRIYALNNEFGSRITNNNYVVAHNIGQIKNNSIISPYMNLFNSESLKLMEELNIDTCYLAPEVDINNIELMKLKDYNLNVGIIGYGKLDLMASKHCIVGKQKGTKNKKCLACTKHNYKIQDEFGNFYPLLLEKDQDCTMRIINDKPINLVNNLEQLEEIGITRVLLIFTDETQDEINKILNEFTNRLKNKSKLYTGFINNEIL